MSIAEAAKATGRTKKTVYQWIREGKVRTMRPMRALWVNLSDIRAVEETTTLGRPRKKG
ncbi:helix-turn-helix domain-containing protein [Microbacterium nanhaiense]|uniref:helix-turn-helix domain-containing protein n=1 Tax=Microbacterium nanhaiense TaxID=1301026 RepID=UPI0035716C45